MIKLQINDTPNVSITAFLKKEQTEFENAKFKTKPYIILINKSTEDFNGY